VKIKKFILMCVMIAPNKLLSVDIKHSKWFTGPSGEYTRRIVSYQGSSHSLILEQFYCLRCANLKGCYKGYLKDSMDNYDAKKGICYSAYEDGYDLWRKFIPCVVYRQDLMIDHLNNHAGYIQKVKKGMKAQLEKRKKKMQ
jgi:hypothetical protein